jgi:hypothetical protein
MRAEGQGLGASCCCGEWDDVVREVLPCEGDAQLANPQGTHDCADCHLPPTRAPTGHNARRNVNSRRRVPSVGRLTT